MKQKSTHIDGNIAKFARIMLILGPMLASSAAVARVIEIGPSTVTDCNEQFENTANTLQPGDELVLRGGDYSQTCRRAITVSGTSDKPIIIRAASGESPVITRPASNMDTQNNIEIVSSSYLVIRGLHFAGGSIGVRFMGGHHITLEDSEVSYTGSSAITMNSGNTDALTLRRNHIHHSGQSTNGTTEGEGMYIGCNYKNCVATNYLIENNYIHDLRGTSDGGNDGIEIKVGSGGNIVRDNVIHDTNIGMRYPCIFVYGDGPAPNIVEGNVVWRCGEAIQVVSDAIIRNNIIVNSAVDGITAAPHAQVAGMKNIQIINNTIVGHPTCLYARWGSATGVVVANNVFACEGGTAIDASGWGSNVTASSNVVIGRLAGVSADSTRIITAATTDSLFTNATNMNYWPKTGSSLLGKANADFIPKQDFNGVLRLDPYDIGAYEVNQSPANPGWSIQNAIKDLSLLESKRPSPPQLSVQ